LLAFDGTLTPTGERAFEDVVSGVGVEEPVEHDPVEFLSRDPVGSALGNAVAVPGEAGVVAVPVLVAVGGAADEAGTAARASDESGEQVVGAVGGTSGLVLPAGDQNLLGGVERLQVNERFVRCRVEALAEEDLTDIGPVAEHSQDRGGNPWTSGASAVTALGEPSTDGSRARCCLV
jgi:hypothetical protein